MSTDRPSFGFNSFLPTSYMNKAEAFAKCLQDKLRSLGSGEEASIQHDPTAETPKTPHGSFSTKFSEEEIADNVFLQGPLSYKRRSVPDQATKPYTNGKTKSKYIGSIADKRGMSSDSDDSDTEPIHPRVSKLQKEQERNGRLASTNSVDSTSSWCSCEEGDPEEDVEVAGTLAAQIKGSPPIHNPRMRNYKRKNRELKIEKPQPPAEEMFFDFEVECFSPVNLEEDNDFDHAFDSAQLLLMDEDSSNILESVDTGQVDESRTELIVEPPLAVTPPPSPNEVVEKVTEEIDAKESEGIEQSDIEREPDHLQVVDHLQQVDYLLAEEDKKDFWEGKDSGIGSCDETSSRAGEDVACEATEFDEVGTEASLAADLESLKLEDKTEVRPQVVVMCEGVEIDESYMPPRMKLRRCSSLKTWKTPPGTPGRKKIVRFADALGLDLADVRTFLDEIPKIPNSAFEDLHYDLAPPAPPPPIERTLIPMFQQPGTQTDFLQRVRQNQVCLESALLTDTSLMSICGVVRVRNLSFHKQVHVRYSKDSWATFSDLQATFVPNSSDGFCDNFSFTLYGHTLNIGDRLEFAVRYDCSAGQFWDSNGGLNYAFQCMPRSAPSAVPLFPALGSSPIDSWDKFY